MPLAANDHFYVTNGVQ